MSMLDDWNLQQELFSAISAAVTPVPVTSAPKKYERYVRMDGWSVLNDELYRNQDTRTHRFFVHVFDAPNGGTESLAWTKSLMGLIEAALKGFTSTLGRGLVMEEAQATFEPRTDENHNAHGFLRYRIQIGG